MKLFTALLVTATASACSPYSPNLGAEPFLCGSGDPRCPDGYTCMQAQGSAAAVCVSTGGGTTPDGGRMGSGGCADDSSLEPNNTIQQAWMTPVDSGGTRKTFTLASLAICPAGDKDIYSVSLSTTATLSATITFDAAQATLNAQILGSQGQTLSSSLPGAGSATVAIANLAGGTYYIQVAGPATGTLQTNNYSLSITEQ